MPPSLRISGCDWSLVKTALDNLYGQCDDGTKVISIDPSLNQTPFGEADTVLHEIFHAILRQQGRAYRPSEEVYVHALATGLCGVLRDNPALLRYLTKSLS